MGSIQDALKKAANKVSDELNKNKWDHNSINSALFMNDSTNVPPNPSAAKPAFQAAGTAAAVPANNTAPAPTPAPASTGSVSVAAQGGINTAAEAAPAQTAPAQAAPAPAPQPAPYVKPVFRSRFAGPVKTTQQSNSLATLPTVDPSQKISNIGTEAAAAPAAESAPAPAPEQAAPVQATPVQAVPAQTVPVQAVPVQAVPAQSVAAQAVPVQAVAGQPNPVLGAVPAAQPAVAASAEAVTPVAAVTEYCYYVQIKHTKTFPAPGSVVLMRSCDHEYVWTNEKSEADKVSYSTCPHCGKPVSNTSVEMD